MKDFQAGLIRFFAYAALVGWWGLLVVGCVLLTHWPGGLDSSIRSIVP